VYVLKGSINVQLAELTRFTEEDAEKIKETIRTLFVNDCSSARPDGSMNIVKLYWWKHNCKLGQYSSKKVHNSIKIVKNDGVDSPSSIDDYTINIHSPQ
ncbi:MAG: type I CRISPR-associated protein Cas7, partial [Oscillospiraceae bacterium]